MPLLLTGCGNSHNQNSSSSQAVEDLTVEGRTTVGLSEYVQLKVSLNKEELPLNQFTFTSSDKNTLTVSSTGIVKGISLGSATVTATKKDNPSLQGNLTIQVVESMVPQNIINRFMTSKSYSIKMEGSYEDIEYKGQSRYYPKSFFYEDDNNNFGYGENINGVFRYTKENGQILSPTYIRNAYTDYREGMYDLLDMRSLSFPSVLSDDDTYVLEDRGIRGMFLYEGIQFYKPYSEQRQEMFKAISSASMKVTSDSSFDVIFTMDVDTVKLTYTLEKETEDAQLNNQLKGLNITYPEVLSPLEDVYQMSLSHNYYRDLGQYTYSQGTKISMGKALFTDKYILYNYSDEYIQATKENAKEELVRKGAIELHKDKYDGVYEFTITKDSSGKDQVNIGSKVLNNGVAISHYYDYYENLTLVLSSFRTRFFRFQSLTPSVQVGSTKTFGNDDPNALAVAAELFSDSLTLFSATPVYFLLTVDAPIKVSANSVINYGIIYSAMGTNAYEYSKYPYSGFNTVSYPLLDDYLK